MHVPCYHMLIEDHMSIIDNHTSALLPYDYRRSYEHSSYTYMSLLPHADRRPHEHYN